MRVMIDTNAYTALMAGNSHLADILAESEAILLPAIVIGELYDGFRGGSKPRENHEALRRFREKPRTICAPITDSTAEWFAEVKQILRKKGRPIPINDVWIAASCMEHGAHLLTLDAHFADIEGLLRVHI